MAIDVTAAVQAAAKHATNLYEGKAHGIQLEECEQVNEGTGNIWRITLSFYLPAQVVTPYERLMSQAQLLTQGEKLTQHYKVFDVDGDGRVLAMKIRQL